MRPKKIGLIAHPGKPGVAELIRTLAAEFDRVQLPVLLEAKTAEVAGLSSRAPSPISAGRRTYWSSSAVTARS